MQAIGSVMTYGMNRILIVFSSTAAKRRYFDALSRRAFYRASAPYTVSCGTAPSGISTNIQLWQQMECKKSAIAAQESLEAFLAPADLSG